MSGASWKIQAIPPSPSPTPSPSPSSSSSSSSSSPGFCSFHRSLRRSSSLPSDVPAYRHGFSACSQLRSKRRCGEFTRSRTFLGPLQQGGNTEILLLLFHPRHQPGIVHHSVPALKLRGRSRAGEASADYSHNSNDQSEHHGRFSRNNSVRKEPSLLLSLIQEIQPLDASLISLDASRDSTDAMKRTVSGMLGLLPSDQFHVTVESSREPLARLLVSSIMTGYTLRNAEYRLCLQKSLGTCDDDEAGCWHGELSTDYHKEHLNNENRVSESGPQDEESSFPASNPCEDFNNAQQWIKDDIKEIETCGVMSEEARKYIQNLKGKLISVTKELENLKRINTSLQMQSIVGEEKNDLLDYLRSLPPDKVAELSQSTSKDVDEVIEHVVNELLDNPSTNLHHKEDTQYSILSDLWDDHTQKCNSSPLQSQSVLTLKRDYLARLLFWCMLLGHHMRSVEYRLELSHTLSLSGDLDISLNGH